MKKIYFAAAIRGGRSDVDLYKELIDHMQEKHRVLTEHIGRKDYLETNKQTDVEIYTQDTNWILESDVLIAECTVTSLGVGYELGFAEAHHKPIHVLYRPEVTHLSAMITGNSYNHVYPYSTKEEAFEIIDHILND